MCKSNKAAGPAKGMTESMIDDLRSTRRIPDSPLFDLFDEAPNGAALSQPPAIAEGVLLRRGRQAANLASRCITSLFGRAPDQTPSDDDTDHIPLEGDWELLG